MQFDYEENGIKFNVHVIPFDELEKFLKPVTHKCLICKLGFHSEKILEKCPNGCEGLVRRIGDENFGHGNKTDKKTK